MIDIYTRDGCTHCVAIKQFLTNNSVGYNELKIGVNIQREEVLAKYPDQRSLPIITINGDVIGSDELKTIIESEQLSLFE